MDADRIVELRDFYRKALLEDVMPFWQSHGVDREHGGFFTCLDRDGSVFCTDKPVWFMGHTTWLYATLHSVVEPRDEWLELARHGHEFLNRFCFSPDGKMYFSVTREGRPLRMRRYVFCEVFAVIALAALARATGDASIRKQAIELFDRLYRYLTTSSMIPPKVDPQTRPTQSLSPRMCLLDVAETMVTIDDAPKYEKIIDTAIDEVFQYFVKADDGVLLETVGPSGERTDAPEGRCVNPGHSIEVAWFLMEIARRRGDDDLLCRSVQIIDWALERGWDTEHGGVLYFVDAEDKPPAQLEHDMKLWWPHSEALYATLFAHHLTGESRYEEWFERVHEWTFDHFPDPQHGEWYGYLHRDGSVANRLKGNMWKGPFHLPRALLKCWKLLEQMAE